MNNIPLLNTKHNFFENSFFPPTTIIEPNNLDPAQQVINSFSTFKEKILQTRRPSLNFVYSCQNSKRIKSIRRLRLRLSHFREHRFKHSFQDSTNPLCNCGCDVESTIHFFLCCKFFPQPYK